MAIDTRVIAGIAAAAVVFGVGAWALSDGAPPPAEGQGEPVFPALTERLEDVTTVEIVKASGAATLTRRDGVWVVAELDGYEADQGPLRELFVGMAELSHHAPRTASPQLYPRLQVEDYVDAETPEGRAASTEVRLRDADGDLVAGLIVGKTGPSLGEGRRSIYVREIGEERAWLAAGDVKVARNPAAWAKDEIANVRSERVVRIELVQDGETLVLTRPAPGRRTMEIAEVPEGRALRGESRRNTVSFGMEFLDLTDARRAPEGLDLDVALWTAAFTTYEGLTVTAYGIPDPDDATAEPWVALRARHGAPDPALADAADLLDQIKSEAEAAAEAEAIDDRASGWLYQVPDHKYERLTTTVEDLLEPVDTAAGPDQP